jgi:hypothetical protein
MIIANLVVKRERGRKKNIILLALDSQINHKYRQNDHFENTIKFEHKEVNQSGQRFASTPGWRKFLQPIRWHHLLLDMCPVMCNAHAHLTLG